MVEMSIKARMVWKEALHLMCEEYASALDDGLDAHSAWECARDAVTLKAKE